jgi:AcrR family transcriptional regulator
MPRTKTAPPKWRRRPEHRPQQILEAALEVFGACGLANARLQDIATRAGVSKGTIYLYFPNKEELFREVIRQTAVAAIERAAKVVTRGTQTEQLLAFMKGYWQFVRSPEFSTIYRLVLGELHQFPDLAKFYAHDVVGRVLEVVSGIIRRGTDTGEFREIDPVVAARMLVALTIMTALWRDEHTGVPLLAHRNDEEVFRELAEFFLHSITATAGAFPQADGAPSDR